MDDQLLAQLKEFSILCVEDEDGIRKIIVDTLKYYFDEVYEASDGDEAYEVYKYYKPKIILSDIQMKNCDGIELVKKIRKDDLKTIIIMLTAYSNEEYLMKLINLDINHFILKPLNAKKLNDALTKILKKNFVEIKLAKDIVLNLEARNIKFGDDIIFLRKREKEFLYLLYQKKGSMLSYYEIETQLWKDKVMTTHALKSFIKELRAKLPQNIIKNIPQEGYCLFC